MENELYIDPQEFAKAVLQTKDFSNFVNDDSGITTTVDLSFDLYLEAMKKAITHNQSLSDF